MIEILQKSTLIIDWLTFTKIKLATKSTTDSSVRTVQLKLLFQSMCTRMFFYAYFKATVKYILLCIWKKYLLKLYIRRKWGTLQITLERRTPHPKIGIVSKRQVTALRRGASFSRMGVIHNKKDFLGMPEMNKGRPDGVLNNQNETDDIQIKNKKGADSVNLLYI